jgi:secreted trypsin-like serine protease
MITTRPALVSAFAAVALAVLPTIEVMADERAAPTRRSDDSDDVQSRRAQPRIVKGEVARPGAYPFQVYLSMGCGGSLVRNNWVLTAAHCLVDTGLVGTPDKIAVHVGSEKRAAGERIGVRAVHVHEQYKSVKQGYDIALLQLERPPGQKTRFSVIPIIEDGNEAGYVKHGAPAIVTGWGDWWDGAGVGSPDLREGRVKLVDRRACNVSQLKGSLERFLGDFRLTVADRIAITDYAAQAAYPVVDDTMLCAGDPTPGESREVVDSCQGDSGGPLFATGPNNTFVQLGIVSWGSGCGRPDMHGVYARVAKLGSWAKARIK